MIKFLKKYWFFGLLAPIFMFGEVLMDLIQPKMMSIIIDNGVLGLNNNNVGDLSLIITMGFKMIGVVIIGGVTGVLSGVFANLFSQNWGNEIRKACFKRVMEFSFEQTDKFSTGSLVTRVTNDVTQMQNLAAQAVRGFVRTSLLFFGGIYCVTTLDLKFGVVLACALPFVAAGVLFFMIKANPFFDILQKKLDRVNSVVQENVAGARVVKAYVKEKYEGERFGKANDELVSTQLKVLKLFAYMTPLSNIVLNIVMVIIIKIGAVEAEAGATTPGSVMAAITYLSQIMHSVMMLAMIFQTVSRGKASASRLNEILITEPVIKNGTFNHITKARGKIEFKNVYFSYPQGNGELVLDGINLTVYPGETFGILGATGSGKSSLVNLIPRFYDTTEGSVFVDDINVKDYKLSLLRDKIAVSLQKSELFNSTVKENIIWGKADASNEEIKIAADNAQASEFIESRVEGFETMVAEKGMSLSGGQKQRIAIARALLKKAEILIFDDSTSALDLKTEAKLYKALKKDYDNVTKIIIAQRIASVKGADRIAIIDNGKIVACDSHEKLLESCEIYRDIYASQLKNGGEINEC
ncbi:MAG: ABC transporter ATP-binding protein [Clostridia bacterium]|nr:ABC transporter ATP-binding protein [Clostridia bacterium]